MKKQQVVRFDTRLSQEQKAFFEYAAHVGGFRSLTDFILQAAQEVASRIVADHEEILASERDKALFFDTVLGASEPNERLRQAAQRFNDLLA